MSCAIRCGICTICSSCCLKMDALPLCFVFFSAVCILPSALSLECYACSDSPVIPGAVKCNSDNLPKVTCPQFFDRCFSIKVVMTIVQPVTMTMRNCSNSVGCNPQSEYNPCNMFNSSGPFDSCELKCCESNLCDPDPSGTISPGTTSPGTTSSGTISVGTISPGTTTGPATGSPTSAGCGLAASFVVILLAVFLMTYVGNN